MILNKARCQRNGCDRQSHLFEELLSFFSSCLDVAAHGRNVTPDFRRPAAFGLKWLTTFQTSDFAGAF